MRSNTLLLCSGVASAFYAIVLLALPTYFIQVHGITTDENGLLFLRCTGALCVAYVVLGLSGYKIKSEDAQKLAIHANFGGWLAMLIVMLYAKFTLPFNSFIFVDIVFCALFSILFASRSLTKL
ncbi:MAG: hypothetical protein ACKOXB_14820 [Flavobacteriales bacterium]